MEVGDDEADGSRTGMRLPVRYSFSSAGFCAVVESDEDGVAHAQSASARTASKGRNMRKLSR